MRAALRHHPAGSGRPTPPAAGLRAAAVLLLLDPRSAAGSPSEDLPLLFIRRGPALTHHPGQVAFPGGAVADGDGSLAATALRETQEEVGIDPGQVAVLGQLSPRPIGVSAFVVTPVVGVLRRQLTPRPDGVEVVSCFWLPLAALLERPPQVEMRTRPDGERTLAPRFELRGHTVWGGTARILHDLLELVRAEL
ncbi:MAG TPA: CoA pyrophosphatase [Candidatus Micrarchaeia archaeon]|nr:CoA pyrophosphatase [Candidatus Micrarchaeia archaeon]